MVNVRCWLYDFSKESSTPTRNHSILVEFRWVEQLISPVRPTMIGISWPRISTAIQEWLIHEDYNSQKSNLKFTLPLISVSCTLDVPMELATLHEYSPMMSANLASMVSVLLYVEVTLSTRVCVREYVVPLVIKVSPSFIHVTLVGGEPVEVQVRVEREEEMLCCIAITWGAAGSNSSRIV